MDPEQEAADAAVLDGAMKEIGQLEAKYKAGEITAKAWGEALDAVRARTEPVYKRSEAALAEKERRRAEAQTEREARDTTLRLNKIRLEEHAEREERKRFEGMSSHELAALGLRDLRERRKEPRPGLTSRIDDDDLADAEAKRRAALPKHERARLLADEAALTSELEAMDALSPEELATLALEQRRAKRKAGAT